MTNRREKAVGLRILSSLSVLVLLGVTVFVLIAGFSYISTTLLTLSALGLIIPATVSSESALEVVAGIFEAVVDGIADIFSSLGDFLGSFFNF